MCVVAALCSQDQISFLINVIVMRVKVLTKVVVECTRLAVVFQYDVRDHFDVGGVNSAAFGPHVSGRV